MFKNLYLYHLIENDQIDLTAIAQQLSQQKARKCESSEPNTMGWCKALPAFDEDELLIKKSSHALIRMMSDQKILPTSVIQEELTKRLKKIEQDKGYTLGKKDKKAIKEQVIEEMLPKAFSKSSYTWGWLDIEAGLLAVDTGSAKKADEFVHFLMKTCPDVGIAPFLAVDSVQARMIEWLDDGKISEGFTIDQACELYEPSEQKPTVTFKDWNLDNEDVKKQIRSGKLPAKLAISYGENLSFVLTSQFLIKSIKFHEKSDKQDSHDDQRHKEETDFFLAAEQLRVAIAGLIDACGGISQGDIDE